MVDAVYIEAARASWTESERQLYPMAVSDTSRYQQIIVVVRAMADELNAATSIEQLMAVWPRAGEMFASVVAGRGLTAASLPQAQIAGSAFALREREIREQMRHQALQERIDAARQAGHLWVVLGETGQIDSGSASSYHCTEMHIASGLAVLSQVEPDPLGGAPSFTVCVIKLDPSTGQWLKGEPVVEADVELERLEDFLAHRNAVRARISSRAVGGPR